MIPCESIILRKFTLEIWIKTYVQAEKEEVQRI